MIKKNRMYCDHCGDMIDRSDAHNKWITIRETDNTKKITTKNYVVCDDCGLSLRVWLTDNVDKYIEDRVRQACE